MFVACLFSWSFGDVFFCLARSSSWRPMQAIRLARPGLVSWSSRTVDRHVNKQREWLITGSKRLQWVTVPAADSWKGGCRWQREKGCGFEKEERGCTAGSVCLGSYSGLHYSSWDTEKNTIYTLGLRYSCELLIFFSFFFSFSHFIFPCLSVSEVVSHLHGVCWNFSSDGSLLPRGKDRRPSRGSVCNLPLRLSTPPFLFRLSLPPRHSFFLSIMT